MKLPQSRWKRLVLRLYVLVRREVWALFDIRRGLRYTLVIQTIQEGIPLRGYNIWLVILSALLASLGLNLNSPAVIIGAMLISPLMGPILGAGLSLGVHDGKMLYHSARVLLYATLIGLGTSMLYYLVSPLNALTPEMNARTYPTALDVGIAFFGGVAGMVSGSRTQSSNALPGVAIATALMPPLCTAGFGLATLNASVFFGAIYLYLLNLAFVTLATYTVVRFLRFPERSYVSQELKRKFYRYTTLVLVAITLPSIYFLYTVYQQLQQTEQAQAAQRQLDLVITQVESDGHEIINWEVVDRDSLQLVKILVDGEVPSSESVRYYQEFLENIKSEQYQLRFFPINLSKDERSRLIQEVTAQLTPFFKEMERQQQPAHPLKTYDLQRLETDLQILFPHLNQVGLGRVAATDFLALDTLTLLLVNWDPALADSIQQAEQDKLLRYVRRYLPQDSVQLLQLPATTDSLGITESGKR